MRQNNNLMVLNTTLEYTFFSQGKTRHNTDDSKTLRGRTKKFIEETSGLTLLFFFLGKHSKDKKIIVATIVLFDDCVRKYSLLFCFRIHG